MRIAAKLVSFLFHPLLLPTYLFLLILAVYPIAKLSPGLQLPPGMGSWAELIMIKIFVLSFFFPMVTVLLLVRLGFVSSIYMPDRMERTIPYIAVIIYFFWTYMVFYRQGENEILCIALLGNVLAVVIAFLVNLTFIKISMHTVGMGVAIGLVRGLVEISNFQIIWILLVVILLAGIVGTARLILNAHRQHEIYAGYLVGLAAQIMAFNIFPIF